MSKEEMASEVAALLDAFESDGGSEEDATKSGKQGEETTGQGEAAAEESLEAEAGEEESGQESSAASEEISETGEPGEQEEPSKDSEVEQLKAKIAELEQKLNKPAEEGSGEQESGEQTSKLPELKPEVQEIDIMGDHSFDDITDDEEKFKSWAKQLVARTQEATQESIYKNLPQVIQAYAEQQLEVKSRAQNFYKDNPDLANYKQEVAKSANLIASAEPGLDHDTFFKKVADHTRYMLGLNIPKAEEKGGEEPEKKKDTKPALNKRSSKSNSRSSTKEPELQGMDKEIAEMLNQVE